MPRTSGQVALAGAGCFLALARGLGAPVDGSALYRSHCASCHGSDLRGAAGPALSGEGFALRWRGKIAALRGVISSGMPLNAPGSLTPSEYRAIDSFIILGDHLDGGIRAASADPARPRAAGPVKLPSAPTAYGVPTFSEPDDAQLMALNPANWLRFNNDLQGQRFSPLSQITTANVGALAPRCIFQTGEVGGFEVSPVVYSGRMYLSTARAVYALDAATCRKLWDYTYPGVDSAPLPNNRGVALYKGLVIRGTLDGHLIALDSSTGKLVWDVLVSDAKAGNFISGAPVVFDGRLFVGDAGSDYGGTARVYAFDAMSGRSLWTFDLVPTGHQAGAETWGAASGRAGGAVWSTITIDPQANQLYVSVGNPGSDLDGSNRPGSNLYTNSVVVLDASSGALQWYVQQVPHDVHDWDTAAAPALYAIDGHRYMAVGSKDGHLYLYDRDDHRLLARKELGRRENDDTPLTAAGIHVCPGMLGGVEWNGPAYDPSNHLVFVNSVDWCITLRTKDDKMEQPGLAGGFKLDPASDAYGWLRAFDAATGEQRWAYRSTMPMLAAVTPTASGLAFTGSTDGSFLAFDSKTGATLYRFNTGGPIAGGISTYTAAGKEYIAVPSGNSSKSLWQSSGAATLIVFGLPE